MEEARKKVVLCAVDTGKYDVGKSLEELAELCDTAELEVVATASQNRERIDSATYIGSGRLDEIAELAKNNDAEILVFDDELNATQLRNIEKQSDMSVIDRTMLILDIFARRAKTREGAIQVELAQLQYRLPRLSGLGTALSRLGGGIGTRGPGETKLESDRRHIRRKIEYLKYSLEQIEKHRQLLRKRRKKNATPTVAIVGYTNVGKSTLLNYLTGAGVLSEDKLFATLDPTARKLKLPDGTTAVFIDTVGFVSRLPHHLVEAFQSTLEEAASADVILQMCDASSPDIENQMKVTSDILHKLGCDLIPVVTVLNKCDKVESLPPGFSFALPISALTGQGIEAMLIEILAALSPKTCRKKLLIPYGQAALIKIIREGGSLFSEEYTENGIAIEGLVPIKELYLFEGFDAPEEG